jgi:hypothetical protein
MILPGAQLDGAEEDCAQAVRLPANQTNETTKPQIFDTRHHSIKKKARFGEILQLAKWE